MILFMSFSLETRTMAWGAAVTRPIPKPPVISSGGKSHVHVMCT